MKSAVNVIYDMREDTQIQELARLREKSYNDMVNSLSLAERKGISIGVKRGREEGISIGEKRGKEKGINEIINKLLKHGMSQAEIDVILKEQP